VTSTVLPHAFDLQHHTDRVVEPTVSDIAEAWLRSEVLPEILDCKGKSKRKSKSVFMPPPASMLGSEEFYEAVNSLINHLGYKAVLSYDGSGEEEVEITWVNTENLEVGDKVIIHGVTHSGNRTISVPCEIHEIRPHNGTPLAGLQFWFVITYQDTRIQVTAKDIIALVEE